MIAGKAEGGEEEKRRRAEPMAQDWTLALPTPYDHPNKDPSSLTKYTPKYSTVHAYGTVKRPDPTRVAC